MAEYKLYFLDANNHVKRRVDLDCVSDEEAVRVVDDHRDGFAMELWQGVRLVEVFSRRE